MIIFGWGHQTIKNFGSTFKKRCNHCNNEKYWILTRTMTWFTLFFIPIFPYSIKYFLTCPLCQYGVILNDEQFDQLEPLAKINQLLIDGKISENEYNIKIEQLEKNEPSQIEEKVIKTKVVDTQVNLGSIFCSGCGANISKEMKFCSNCGIKTSSK